ncbi:peptidoglycan-binding domain-containing protein [Glutamicibacter sp. AOP5-A2-18]|uniref:peptidoglycan-binding domain-containing protein n=1 Tax=Glutamicibacter sp. AOP5-A2-18 TaxID=3457656 RepID=UPI00403480E0
MALTRLGWDVLEPSSTRLTNLPWITGKVRNGDAYTILNELGRRFNSEVETIRKDWSWGYAKRPVRGASVASEHSAGVGVDFNAPAHGLGLSGTFSGAQVKSIHKILADLDGAVRWGGDYRVISGDPNARLDEMHFELQGGLALLKRVADKIRAGSSLGTVTPQASKPKPAPKPASTRPTDYAKLATDGKFGKQSVEATQILMSQIGLYERAIDGDDGKYTWMAVQEWLNGLGYYKRAVDGSFGKHSVIALQKFLAAKGHLDTRKYLIDGKLGKATVRAFQTYLNTQNGGK